MRNLNLIMNDFLRYAVFLVLFSFSIVSIFAQNELTRTTIFDLPKEPTKTELEKNDLQWIKTGNYFDQTKFDTAEKIDAEIGKIIQRYDRETAIITFDVPFNSKRLVAPKFQRYTDYNPQIQELISAKNVDFLKKEAYIWRYGNIDIAVNGNTFKDQLNVYSLIRAIEIIKYRYPEAYKKLFVEIREYSDNSPQISNCKNKFSHLLFSFNDSPVSIAAGETAWSGQSRKACNSPTSNVSVVSIDSENIQGTNRNAGSYPVYLSSPNENYMRYLREGLIESLVHEMMHRYVDHQRSHQNIFNILYDVRLGTAKLNGQPFVDINGTGEETIVTTTSLHYFIKKGGLQSSIHFLYAVGMTLNISSLINYNLADKYTGLVDPSNTGGTLYKDRLRLTILD